MTCHAWCAIPIEASKAACCMSASEVMNSPDKRLHALVTLQALKAAQMESRLLQQERMAQQSELRAAQMENRIAELQRMLEGARGQS